MNAGFRVRFILMISAFAGVNIGYTAILPFLPQMRGALHLTPALLTTFLLAYPAGEIASQWVLGGRLTDRWGPAFAASLAWSGGAAGMAIVAIAWNPVTGIAGRLVWGLGSGIGIPAIYRAAGLMAERYGVPVARLRAQVGAGAVLTLALGPLVAGIVQGFAGFRLVLAVGVALSVLGAVTAAFALRLPETAGPAMGPAAGPAAEPTGRRADPAVDAVRAGGGGWLLPLVVFGGYELVLNLLLAAIEPLIPLYIAGSQHDSTGRSALILGVGLGVYVVATLLCGHLPDRLRGSRAGTATLLLLAVSCLGLSELRILPVALAAIAVFMFAQGHGYLVARTGIDTHTDGSGTVWGRFNAIADVGYLLGPVAAVTAYTLTGAAAFPLFSGVTVLAAAGFLRVSAVLDGSRRVLPADEVRLPA